jgi:colicin import membrane protein
MSADRCAARLAATSRGAAGHMADSDRSRREAEAAHCIAAEAPEAQAAAVARWNAAVAESAGATQSVEARCWAARTAARAEAAMPADLREGARAATSSQGAGLAATAVAEASAPAEADTRGTAELAAPAAGRAAAPLTRRPSLSPCQRNKDTPFSTAEPLSRRWGRSS